MKILIIAIVCLLQPLISSISPDYKLAPVNDDCATQNLLPAKAGSIILIKEGNQKCMIGKIMLLKEKTCLVGLYTNLVDSSVTSVSPDTIKLGLENIKNENLNKRVVSYYINPLLCKNRCRVLGFEALTTIEKRKVKRLKGTI
ncbi:MAG: hypothetical protein MUC87_18810 [Bacteroidia bacterium]|jgi:hypothetical protein|nr:hypothetical protein [Bacteroidia bacterium]